MRRGPMILPREYTPEDEERDRLVDQMVDRLLGGCTEEEFSEFKCPYCGSPLSIDVHPTGRLFFIGCSASTVHLARTVKAESQAEWWKKKISRGWTSCD